MTLAALLAERGIKRALIVDDACDAVPTAADVRAAAGEWGIFIDDLDADQLRLIEAAYPAATGRRFDDLINDDGYVGTVWGLREELGDVTTPLFEVYNANQAADDRFVQIAKERLEAMGLEVDARGRDFNAEAQTADLILMDLYLGGAQDDLALTESKNLLKIALINRAAEPPLIILMSRSGQLDAKRDEFRDDVGLAESGFRILRKADLEGSDILERQLGRLAENVEDARRLTRFIHALETGISAASMRTVALLRKLKLSDVGRIQQLLLDVEGEPTGSYLVDVFDRVLQHEIEADEGIIAAATDLNGFSAARHPPPYVAGSTDLQQLVARLVTQHVRRLGLPGSNDARVTFGDVLRPMANPFLQGAPENAVHLTADEVRVVMTPVCDLQRDGAPSILFLLGKLKDVSAKSWAYGSDARTPSILIDDELRWIKWDLKRIDTMSREQVGASLDAGEWRIVARLRESHALELQQRMLAGLGRVGLVAALPATFLVDVEAYYAALDGKLVRLDVPQLVDGAVCYVGRDENGDPNVRLALTEGGCDGLSDALLALPEELVAEAARTALNHIKSSGDLTRMVSTGIDLKGVGSNAWKHLDSETGGNAVPKMGLIAWNFDFPAEPLAAKNLNKAGIAILIKDATYVGAVGLNDAIRSGALTRDAPPMEPAEHQEPPPT